MKSKRLLTVASFVSKEDIVIDIGCDHAYLPIYLVQNKLCQKVYATDIHEKALLSAQENVKKSHLEKEIGLYVADGFKDIPVNDFNTIVIAGMGTSTILHILDNLDGKRVKKLILQSNNDLPLLRVQMRKKGYYLQEEKVVYEKNHYYVVGLYTKNKRVLSKKEQYFGIYNSEYIKYYQYIEQKLKEIYKKIGKYHIKEKIALKRKLGLLKKYL